MNQREEARIRKNNMKLYPIYEMLGLDYLFLYGIDILFLAQVKGFSNSQIILVNSIYAIFNVFLQIPIVVLVNKIGKRKGVFIRKYIKVIGYIFTNVLQILSRTDFFLFYKNPWV